MACFQDQIKDFPWTPERVASLFKEIRDDYISKGVTDFARIVKGLSATHGLRPEIIVKGLSRPEGSARRMANEMWLSAQHQRMVESQARALVPQMESGKWATKAKQLINFPRQLTLYGHFAAFSKSHLSDQLFYNPGEYARNFTRSWALISKGGRAAHEARLMAAFSDADPDYVDAKRSGLDLGNGKFFKEVSEITGKKDVKTSKVSMAFDELRMRRLEIWKKELANLSPEERANPQQLKDLAAVMNHDTGATEKSNSIFRFIFLSPRLFPAQLAHTFRDIPKAMFETGLGTRWNKASPASRYVARKTAILVGAQAALLAANQGLYMATGDKQFKPNLSDIKSDLGRVRLFGYSIPTSPTVELAKLPLMMIAAGIAARHGENRVGEMLGEATKVALGRQNPLFSIAEEAIAGQNPITGKPTPYAGALGEVKPRKGEQKQGWLDYLGNKLPIPMANYVREFDDELELQGLNHQQRDVITRAMTAGTMELMTSYHASPTFPSKKKYVELGDLPGVRQVLGRPQYKPGK